MPDYGIQPGEEQPFGPEDFNQMLLQQRRRKLAEIAMQQGQANTAIPDISQPQIPQEQAQVPIQARAITPYQPPQAPPTARQAYEETLKQSPQKTDYKPSRLRSILGNIGGIATGISTLSIPAGSEMADYIKYAPFREKQRQFQTGLAQKEALMKSEEAGKKEEVTLEEGRNKAEAERARAGAEESRKKTEEAKARELVPGTPEFGGKLAVTEAGKETELEKKLFNLKLHGGRMVKGARYKVDPLTHHGRYIGPNNEEYGSGAIEEATEQKNPEQQKFSNAFEAEYSNYLSNHDYQTPPPDWIEATTRRLAEASGLFQQRQAGVELSGARAEQARAGAAYTRKRAEDATPVEIQQAKDFLEKHPEQYGSYIKQFSDIKRRSILAQVPPIALVGTQEQTRVANAHTALLHARTTRDLIDDPWIKANLGPILGRLDLASSSFGGNPIGATPEEAEKEQEFLSFLTANLLWETTSGVGTRPARQTIELIKRTAPRASETYERIKGALDAQEKSAQNVIEGILYGGKSPSEKKEGLSEFHEVNK